MNKGTVRSCPINKCPECIDGVCKDTIDGKDVIIKCEIKPPPIPPSGTNIWTYIIIAIIALIIIIAIIIGIIFLVRGSKKE